MRLLGPSWLLLISLVTSSSLVIAKSSSEPRIKKTLFDNLPAGLFYFDDTDIVIVQDQEKGNIHRSTNAGETWNIVKYVPEGQAWDVWQHPYDNKRAYVLGKKETHWVTSDQGESWTEFKLRDATPTIFRPPLSFHAGDPKKVLLHGQRCEGWDCTEIVSLLQVFTCDTSILMLTISSLYRLFTRLMTSKHIMRYESILGAATLPDQRHYSPLRTKRWTRIGFSALSEADTHLGRRTIDWLSRMTISRRSLSPH